MELEKGKKYYAIQIVEGKIKISSIEFENISMNKSIISLKTKVRGSHGINLVKSEIKSCEDYISAIAYNDSDYWYSVLFYEDSKKAKNKLKKLYEHKADLAISKI